MDGEVQIAECWQRGGRELGAFFIQSELPGPVGDEAGGTAGAVGVVPGDLLGEEGVGRIEIGAADGAAPRRRTLCRETRRFLEGAEAALDFPLGQRVRGDAVGDAQTEQGARELGAEARRSSGVKFS